MVNILIVDDEMNVLDIEKKIVEKYFHKNDITDFCIDTAINGAKAIEKLQEKEYHLLFLDYMMPVSSGLDVLDHIRESNTHTFQPYACMVTAMGTPENLELFKQKKASSYILKPFSLKTIFIMLDTYIKPLIEKAEATVEFDEFMDFEDFDEFEDFENTEDDIDLTDEEKEIMRINNLTHQKIPAVEFLSDFDSLEYLLEDVNEIDESLTEIIENLDIETLENSKNDINNSLSLYVTFLRSLSDFEHLANTINYLQVLIEEVDLSHFNDKYKSLIIELIRAILKDLVSWKDSVFIKKDAIDVFYIGASCFNSYLQLKELIKVKE